MAKPKKSARQESDAEDAELDAAVCALAARMKRDERALGELSDATRAEAKRVFARFAAVGRKPKSGRGRIG